jgi:HEAT repeat protein
LREARPGVLIQEHEGLGEEETVKGLGQRSRVAGIVLLSILLPWSDAPGGRVTHFIGQLEHRSLTVRLQAAYFLGRLKDARAVPSLVKSLADPWEAVRAAAAISLRKLGGPLASAGLANALGDRSPWVRAEAVRGVGLLEEREAWPKVVAALDDEDFRVRLEAVRALGRLGERGAALPLARVIEQAPEGDELREEARTALRRLAPHLQWEEMAFLLKSGADKRERARAVLVLAALGDARSVPTLIEALSDQEPDVRAQTVAALGGMDDRRAIEPLARVAAGETDRRVRDLARRAVDRLLNKVGRQ